MGNVREVTQFYNKADGKYVTFESWTDTSWTVQWELYTGHLYTGHLYTLS